MTGIPQLQIQLIHAKLGHQTHPAKLEIRQPKAELNMKQTPARLTIRSPQGELHIDQSRAWDALGIGNNLELMSRIYANARNVAMEGIARIARNGDQMAKIHTGTDMIAQLAVYEPYRFHEFNVLGHPSSLNVDIRYHARKPDIQVEQGGVRLDPQINKPVMQYAPGKVQFTMLQYPKVEITPPQIDRRI